MAPATSKSLKMNYVQHFAFAPGGVAFLNGSTKQKVGWGLCRLDLSTQKVNEVGTDTIARRVSGPFAALRDAVVGVEVGDDLRTTSVVALDATTGAAGTRFGAPRDRTIAGLLVSPDLEFAGVLSADRTTQKASLEVFEAQSGKSVFAAAEAAAFAFSEAGDGVVYLTAGALVHQPLAKGKAKKVACAVSLRGALTRQGPLLLGGGQVVDETTGKLVLGVNHHRVTWGPREGTLVREGAAGLVELIDLKGRTLEQFYRPRKNDADHVAMSPTGWWLASTGSYLELYALGDEKAKTLAKAPPPPRAAAKKREVPSSGAVKDPRAAKLLETFWNDPDDLKPLRVWADLLAEHGDVRAEYVQLSLLENRTEAQDERRFALKKKEAGRLVGPARPFLRQWTFGSTGLVESAICEAEQLVAHFDEIAALHPRLELSVTSLRKKTMATIAQLAGLPLARLGYLRLEANALSDKAVVALAPGLKGLVNLSLDGNDVTGAGLSGMAPHFEALEFLALGTSMAQRDQRADVVAGWVDALTAPRAFPKLRALHFRGGYSGVSLTDEQRKRLTAKPGLKLVKVSDYPAHGGAIAAWKRGEA
jgi:hypothetical protein